MSVLNKKIKLANPRGFCAGVDRAIDIVNKALDKFGSPVYVKHEVVHNKFVVKDLENRGAVFVESIDEVPDNSLVIFSAHGVSEAVENKTKKRNLNYFDATCPLVTKVHNQVSRYSESGFDIVLIGHEGHPEVEGTMGRHKNESGSMIYLVQDEKDAKNLLIKNNNEKIALVTQTTLSVDDTKLIIKILKRRFPQIKSPKSEDICYATQNRQDAVKQLALESDLLIVVGSKNSSNSNRLRELAEKCGCKSVLIDEFDELDINILNNFKKISITAGASAPEERVQEIAQAVKSHINGEIVESGTDNENIYFKLPAGLR